MDFRLSYSGAPGAVIAQLAAGGQNYTSETLADGRAARKWARRTARDHKLDHTPEPTSHEFVTISGAHTFSL